MKNIRFILVFFLLIAGASGAYYYFNKPVAPVLADPMQLLPSDTLAAVTAIRLTETIDQFRRSPLGKTVGTMDWEAAANSLGIRPEETIRAKETLTQARQILSSTWCNEIFGQQAAIGLLPPAAADIHSTPPQEVLKETLILVARPQKPSQFLDILGKMVLKEIQVTAETYEGHNIKRVTIPDGPAFFYAVQSGYALIGLNPRPVLLCMTPKAPVPERLTATEGYRALAETLFGAADERFRSYLNVEALVERFSDLLSSFLNEMDQKEQETLKNSLAYLSGIRSVGAVSLDNGGPVIHERLQALIDPGLLHPQMVKSLSRAPELNPTLAMATQTPIFYFWQNYQDFMQLWEMAVASDPDEKASIDQFKAWFKGQLDMEVEEVLAAFDSQIMWVFNDVTDGGLFPAPELAVSFKMKDAEIFTQLLSNIASGMGVNLQTESHPELTITHAVTPIGDAINPAFACKEGFCTLATNRQLLKTLLSPAGRQPLTENPKFKAVSQGWLDPSNQLAFLDLEEALKKTRLVIDWGANWVAAMDPQNAPNRSELLDKAVYPLLEGFSMYQAAGLRTLIKNDRISTDISILVRRTNE